MVFVMNFLRALAGDASVYLPAVNFIVLLYSRSVSNHISEQGFKLAAHSDYDFMKNVFTMLQALFSYSPPFRFEEFFAPGHAINRKVTFVLTLINLVKQK